MINWLNAALACCGVVLPWIHVWQYRKLAARYRRERDERTYLNEQDRDMIAVWYHASDHLPKMERWAYISDLLQRLHIDVDPADKDYVSEAFMWKRIIAATYTFSEKPWGR